MPAATQEISEPLIRDNINRAVCDVFKTMLHRSASLGSGYTAGGAERSTSNIQRSTPTNQE